MVSGNGQFGILANLYGILLSELLVHKLVDHKLVYQRVI